MISENNLVKIFARCFRLLAQFNAGIKDTFFYELYEDETEKLLEGYVKFLETSGDGGVTSVAQCEHLIFQIKRLIFLLDIIKYLGFSNAINPLLLEKNLLSLELLILDFKNQKIMDASSRKPAYPTLQKTKKEKTIIPVFNKIRNEIASFISSREKVQNTEVFEQFSYITRRTLKRKLSELVNASSVKRLILGKKVFYTANKES